MKFQRLGWKVTVAISLILVVSGCSLPDFIGKSPCENDDTRKCQKGESLRHTNGGKDWGAMPMRDRKEHMSTVVLPKMTSLFAAHNSKYQKSGAIHCQSCHGQSKADNKTFDFTQPSRLYPLDPYNLPTENDKDPRIAKAVRFMKRQVMPQMSRLLGEKVTCFNCHAVDGRPTKAKKVVAKVEKKDPNSDDGETQTP